jgi:glycosyltransferase involved in cell wall biosynthesis
MKKTVLYIIDSLEKGGAEIMLVSPLAEIHRHYKIILVTLRPENVFKENELIYDKRYCLDMKSRLNLLTASRKLKKIISENNVTLVHSFLYWSGIVARIACGKKISYTFSLATMMNGGVYRLKKWSGYTLLLDRFTYRKNHFVISPTNEVLDDFNNSVGLKGESAVLYNFVKKEFFDHEIDYKFSNDTLKLVAVGNLKSVKNYQLLIEAFKLLGNLPVSLDIYGEGQERSALQQEINKFGLAIELKGSHENIYEILPNYDAYVMSSFIEGFGVSAAEAMAVGIPLLLSDIKVLREISEGNALFFDPFKPESFVAVINQILAGDIDMKNLSEKVKEIARNNYTQGKYLRGLFEVYKRIIPGSVLEVNNKK